jgi:outer membrane protein OmpA-like peptidoglycan-associated protein
VADNILYSEAEFETKIVEKETVVARSEVRTTAAPREVELVTPLNSGQRLAEQYSFLTSAAGTDLPKQVLENSDDEKVIERALAEARKGSVSIYFKQGVRRIDRVFGNNEKNLHQLITVIQELCAAKDVKIAALIVAGFASPEGSPQLNERLAHARATSVRNYLVANTDVDSTVTRVFNGKADWLGLRELVAKSNMEQRDQIIDIIDNVPIEASMVETEKGTKRIPGRMRQLMRLDGGKPYAFMLNYLFPELRQAAYIKIFYEEK